MRKKGPVLGLQLQEQEPSEATKKLSSTEDSMASPSSSYLGIAFAGSWKSGVSDGINMSYVISVEHQGKDRRQGDKEIERNECELTQKHNISHIFLITLSNMIC